MREISLINESRPNNRKRIQGIKRCSFRTIDCESEIRGYNPIILHTKSGVQVTKKRNRCRIRAIPEAQSSSNGFDSSEHFGHFVRMFVESEFDRYFPLAEPKMKDHYNEKTNEDVNFVSDRNGTRLSQAQRTIFTNEVSLVAQSEGVVNNFSKYLITPSDFRDSLGQKTILNPNPNSFEAASSEDNLTRVIDHLFKTGFQFSSLVSKFQYSRFSFSINFKMKSIFKEKINQIFQSFNKKEKKLTSLGSSPPLQAIFPNYYPIPNDEISQSSSNESQEKAQTKNEGAVHKINKQLKGNQVSGQSKFHNLKKSFMHALIMLFSIDVLSCFDISQIDQNYLMQIINRMRIFSTKSRGEKASKYEYYSHNHYTTLLLKLTSISLPLIYQKQYDLEMHQFIYKEDFNGIISPSDFTSIKCNYYKNMVFQLIYQSLLIVEELNENLNNLDCEQRSLERYDYILRVKTGIVRLNNGTKITRF